MSDHPNCRKCGSGLNGPSIRRLAEEEVCEAGLSDAPSSGCPCPGCGLTANAQSRRVRLLLTEPDAPRLDRLFAPEVEATICSRCRVLFFDDRQYERLVDRTRRVLVGQAEGRGDRVNRFEREGPGGGEVSR